VTMAFYQVLCYGLALFNRESLEVVTNFSGCVFRRHDH
jgi:hypothetical protein